MTTAAAELPGRTTIDERAIRRIAAQAAREVAGVESGVQVVARIAGDSATLRVRLPIRYPLPIAKVAAECRAHLMERTRELSGLTVPRVDIEVSALPIAMGERRVR